MAAGVGIPKVSRQAHAETGVPAGSTPAVTARFVYLDNVRLFLTIVLVLHHLAITYGAEGSWFYREPTGDLPTMVALTVFAAVNQAYFMGLFYFIAGYFTPGSLDQKGTAAFLRDRLVRLGIPLIVYSLLLSPVVEGVKGMTEGWLPTRLGPAILARFRTLQFTPGPLWFVEGLLVFSAVYALGRALLAPLRPQRAAAPVRRIPLTQRALLAGAVVMALATFVARLAFPLGYEWQHIMLGAFPQYIIMFGAGIVAQRQGWLPDIARPIRRTWATVAIVGIVGWLPILLAGGALDEGPAAFMGGSSWKALAYALWESLVSVGMSVTVLSLFRRRLDGHVRLSHEMARDAYTVYIVHAPVIVLLALSVRGIDLYPLLKWALLAPVAVALSFAVAHLVRRVPLAPRVL